MAPAPTPPQNPLPALAVLTPAVAAFAIPLAHALKAGRRGVEALALTASASTAFLAVALLLKALRSPYPITYEFGGWPPPVGIFYEVDALGAALGALTACVMLLVTLYSTGYGGLGGGGRLHLYYTLLMVVEAGMLGCFYTGDFFNLFVMLEVTSIASYALVSFRRWDRVAVEASLKYAIFGALATTAYFAAAIFAYGSLGTLNMADMHLKILGEAAPASGRAFGAVGAGVALFTALALYAFTFKSALFPNHFWLPDAHSSAPTPVSALLSALVVNVGVYAIGRFAYTVFGHASPHMAAVLSYALLACGAASAVVGGVLMNVQTDVKKLVAYSTVMNLGYAALGYGLSTSLGAAAATYHLITHAAAKALLFMGVGGLIAAAGSRRVADLAGLGRREPFLGFAVGLALLTMAGVPPLSMFMSEYALMTAMIRAGNYLALAAFLAAYAAGAAAYLRLFYVVCVKPPARRGGCGGRRPLGGGAYAALALLAVAAVALGVGGPWVFSHVALPAGRALMDSHAYVKAFLNAASALGGG